ncbi:MAG: putative ABC transporter permease [Methanocorpusculum sp.]|nr:putative ABC transporter permease [Methanocorpusculum sp.]
MIDIAEYILWFFIYGFLGWIWETSYCSVREHRFINRGFLNGPIIPIYGFGAVLVMFVLSEIGSGIIPPDLPLVNIPIVFIGGLILCTILEYFTAVILESIFHIRWWDYSNQKFNFQGRICLKSALFFGLMSVIVIYVVHPLISGATTNIPDIVKNSLVIGFLAGSLVDVSITVFSLVHINKKIEEIQRALSEAREHLSDKVEEVFSSGTAVYDTAYENLKKSLYKQRYQIRRLANAFPTSKSNLHTEAWETFKEFLKKRD